MQQRRRIFTVPNQITLLRLGFLPIFLTLIAYERYRWALLVLVVAGLSDAIDGLLARKLNQHSSLGAYLDPIADKLLLSSSFIILAYKTRIAWWTTIIVISRDILMLTVAVVIILISGYRPFPPSILGKLTTFFEIVLVFTVVLTAAYPQFHSRLLHNALVDIVTFCAAASALHYSFLVTRHHPPAQTASIE
ncbi:MAG TPA: CDP-alcohol phosphatidyltransferase family protein [Candidatus Acidoferrum sp.]|jgi:cardiolipin synthase